ncbi:lung adenoma susceptibility protein 2 [Phyllostomus discolor]|uniref:Lung adenoma susceptibility protein 2 n=1 Tax=Phyllostomus discolor TaxID=89673 RepID=A0A833Z476_9CHIR|nr:lung adenoma susceptibility protein 2 [Phyllostomus discolor]
MAKSNSKHRVCSRQSSVSSLLASCSLSGSHSSSSDGSFQYKDKLYSSASQALQAYIDDFDLSQMCPGVTTGKMNIYKCSANVPEFSSYVYKPNNAFENFDHRKGSLSSRRRTTNDIDSISLTTDDLLKLPADGSFPFTCVGPGHRGSKKTKRGVGRLGSSDTEKSQHFQEPSTAMSEDNLANRNVNGKQSRRLKNLKLVNNTNKCIPGPSLSSSKKSSLKDSSEHNLEKNYPRWLTGQKSDLNVSGITSIPDFKYPVWLHNQDLLPDTQSQRIHKIFKEEQCSPRHSYQAQRTSRLTSKLGCFEYPFEPSNISDFLSGDKGLGDKIELLILKAKRNLEHCTEDLPKPMKQDDSPCSLDKLEAERSWENIPVTFKSPVPVDSEEGPQQASRAKCDKQFLEDFLNDDNQVSEELHPFWRETPWPRGSPETDVI